MNWKQLGRAYRYSLVGLGEKERIVFYWLAHDRICVA